MNIRNRKTTDNPVLLDIWLRSVRATHAFLSAQDIEDLYPQVRDIYLPAVDIVVAEAPDGHIVGFVGTQGEQIEMLFVDPDRFSQGTGRALLDHMREGDRRLTVDVNEQNPRARAFYRRYGFIDVGRSAVDSAGRPFPLVHMVLAVPPEGTTVPMSPVAAS